MAMESIPVRAILSDIKGNLEALTAALEEIRHQAIDVVYNLGNTLGFGPNPVECLDLAREMTVVLRGDHEERVLSDAPITSKVQHKAWSFNREQLEKVGTQFDRDRRLQFLRGLARSHQAGGILHVLGTPRDPINEYLFPDDIYNQRKMQIYMSKIDAGCFCGKTHIPGIFIENQKRDYEFLPAAELENGCAPSGRKWICNVGAVGYSRDQDPRASYVLFDNERIWFRRVAYDWETTIRKIRERDGT